MPDLAFLTEPAFVVAAMAALAGSVMRGFAGFGAGLLFMPVAAACFGPRAAAPILFLIDTILILPFVLKAVRVVDWREILPLGVSAMATVPAGVFILTHFEAVTIRWGLSAVIVVMVAVLASGWRYRGPTRIWLSALVGGTSGVLSGTIQAAGPPVLVYWLGRDVVSRTVRANALVFLCFTTVISGIAFAAAGLFTTQVVARSAALFPVYAAGLAIGGRLFGLASEATYRRIAYAAIIFVAIASMPIFA